MDVHTGDCQRAGNLMLSRYVKSPVLRAVAPGSEGTQMDAGRPKGEVRTEESGQHHNEAS
jgi:hypothetical protein